MIQSGVRSPASGEEIRSPASGQEIRSPASGQEIRSPAFGEEIGQHIDIDRQRLRVSVRHGRHDRVPLLVVNGIGASLELLQPFVDQLDPSLSVIRFDAPGVGGSPLPSGPYRFSGLCKLMARMLSHLGHESVDVLGISWGGGVAQHFAAFHRRRCRRLVLVSTATGAVMVLAKPNVLMRMITPRRYTEPGYAEQHAPRLYGGSARTDPGGIGTHMHGHHRGVSSQGYAYQLTAGLGWTSLPFLPRLRQPTLIVSGNDDPIIPVANAHLMHRLIPHSRLHVFDGGHLGLVTEAAQLAPVVERFLTAADHAAARPGRFAHWPADLRRGAQLGSGRPCLGWLCDR